jgi:hypothetical protein
MILSCIPKEIIPQAKLDVVFMLKPSMKCNPCILLVPQIVLKFELFASHGKAD